MAQMIKLKRSAVAGRVPTTANLDLGELAINVRDGKLFFKRDDDSIQTILTTNSVVTGNVNLDGILDANDVTIDAWGSVSGSLATLQANASRVSDSEIRITSTNSVDYEDHVKFDGATITGAGTDLDPYLVSVGGSGVELTDVQTTYATVKNVSGTTLQKGTPLAVVPGQTSGNVSDVVPADAADPAFMPAVYILNEDLADELEGEAIIFGKITGIDTSAFDSGTTVYVAPGGGWTNVKPVYPNKIQNLGIITKSHATNGGGEVMGAGRSNDVPNIAPGKVWVGTSTYPTESTTIHLDETNGRLGIGTTSPSDRLEVYNNGGDAAIRIHEDAGTHEARLHLRRGGSDWEIINGNDLWIEGEGVERFRISTAGNVGIGTTSPTNNLHVVGNTRVGSLLVGDSAASNTPATTLHIKSSGTSAVLRIEDSDNLNSYYDFLVDEGNGLYFKEGSTSRLFIKEGGNIGIGTTSPDRTLSVHSPDNTRIEIKDTTENIISHWGVNGGAMFITTETNHPINLYTNSTKRLSIDSGGIVTINNTGEQGWSGNKLNVGSTSDGSNGINILTSATGNAYIIFSDVVDGSSNEYANQIRYSHTDNFLAIQTVGSERMRITSNGNVGIGTTSPTHKLDVSGDANFSGLLEADSGILSRNKIQISQGRLWELIGDTSGFTIKDGSANQDRVTIDTAGNVGIGTTTPNSPLEVYGSGSTVLDIQGSQGQLFSVSDSLTGSLMSVNDISGLPILEVFDTDKVVMGEFGANTLVVTGSKVGIGTDSPDATLHVESTGVTAGGYNYHMIVDDNNAYGINEGGGIIFRGDYNSATAKANFGAIRAGKANANDGNANAYLSLMYGASGTLTEGLRVNWDGNVGIGTTSPIAKLDVAGDTRSTNFQVDSGNRYKIGNNSQYITGTNDTAIDIVTGGSVSLRVADNGYVGIGTTGPTALLQVGGGTSNAGSSVAMLSGDSSGILNALSLVNRVGGQNGRGVRLSFHNNSNWSATGAIETIQTDNTAAALAFRTYDGSLTEKMRITTDGKVGIGTTNPAQKLQVDGSIYSNGGEIYVNGDKGVTAVGNLLFKAHNGSNYFEGMRLTSTGNVGIGTTSPTPKLHLVYSGGTYSTDATSGFINQADTGRATMRLRSINDEAAELFFDINGGIQWDISARPSTQGNELRFYPAAATPSYSAVSGHTLALKQDGTIQFATYGAGVLTTDSAGNVGVSTAYQTQATADGRYVNVTGDTMTGRLILSDATSATGLLITANTPASQGSVLNLNKSAADKQVYQSFEGDTLYLGVAANQTSVANIGTKGGVHLDLGTGYSTRMRITSNGQVGIGTTAPASGYSLDVNGAVISNQSFRVRGTETGNPTPVADNVHLSGYGVIGNRGTLYLTNAGGDVQIGNGSTHNASPTATFGGTAISLLRSTDITGRLDVASDLRLRGSSSSNDLGVVRLYTDAGNHLYFDTGNNGGQVAKFAADGSLTLDSSNSQGLTIKQSATSGADMQVEIRGSRNNPSAGVNPAKLILSSFDSDDGAGVVKTGAEFYMESTSLTGGDLTDFEAGIRYRKDGAVIDGLSIHDGEITTHGSLRVIDHITLDSTTTLDNGSATGDPVPVVIEQFDSTTYIGVFLDFTIYNDSKDNMRSGTLQVVFNGTEVMFNEVNTMDIGDTSGCLLDAVNNAGTVDVRFTTPDPTFHIKYHVRTL